MRIGLALPQYDYSVAGERPLRFETIVDYALRAERGGQARALHELVHGRPFLSPMSSRCPEPR